MAKEKTSTEINRTTLDPQTLTSESLKGVLHRTSYGVYYDLLQTPAIPEFLDYNRIVCSLCTVMEQIYKKFLDESWFLPQRTARTTTSTSSASSGSIAASSTSALLVQAIKDIDAEFKHLFFGLLSRDITDIAVNHLKKQTESIATLKNNLQYDKLPPLFSSSTSDDDEPSGKDSKSEWFQISFRVGGCTVYRLVFGFFFLAFDLKLFYLLEQSRFHLSFREDLHSCMAQTRGKFQHNPLQTSVHTEYYPSEDQPRVQQLKTKKTGVLHAKSLTKKRKKKTLLLDSDQAI